MRTAAKLTLAVTCLASAVMLASCALASPEASEDLILSPAITQTPADQMDDAELLAMFQETLYPNGIFIYSFMNAEGLDLDDTAVLPNMPDNTMYILVNNIPNMSALKTNYEAVFSATLCKGLIYPAVLEGGTPLFKESGGTLYFNYYTGGGVGYAPDFTRAAVLSKSADSFEIEVPMTTPGDTVGTLFTFMVMEQNGYWVLDSFFLFQANEETA